jgi:hypothetical protein
MMRNQHVLVRSFCNFKARMTNEMHQNSRIQEPLIQHAVGWSGQNPWIVVAGRLKDASESLSRSEVYLPKNPVTEYIRAYVSSP